MQAKKGVTHWQELEDYILKPTYIYYIYQFKYS